MAKIQLLYKSLFWLEMRPLNEFPSIFIYLIVDIALLGRSLYVVEMLTFDQI